MIFKFRGQIYLVILLNLIAFTVCNDIPDITIPNYDVREKYLSCYNEGYSANYKDGTKPV